ncbi:PREDICTED: uncharacterized protein LOC106116046 [Papilio xuthus]|uniref:Uncharacterized protein LOC106116046 n=1 Tax=Papilio xuthus TaxID=66420 RepID=A0AAJ6Z4L2_PAPXU|nr:PREDICTED: uncharacterized protein LOC106116046 [Papilio xuthus]
MQFVKSILILSLGYLTLAEVNNDFDNFSMAIKEYLDTYSPEVQSRLLETTDVDPMELAYRIGNATKNILENAEYNNDDESISAKLMNMNTEITEKITKTNIDSVTKDPFDEENLKLLASKAFIEDKYIEITDNKTTEVNDDDAEMSLFLQNMNNEKSSTGGASKKDAAILVPKYIMERGD